MDIRGARATEEFLARLRAALERLRAALERLLPDRGADAGKNRGRDAAPTGRAAPRYAVAFSGGVDSTVLVAALRRLVPPARLVALHIDHGLDSASLRWSAHCARVAAALEVAFASRRVTIGDVSSHGLEAAARRARYAALAELMAPGDVVLTAHHGDDQLETLLLRMLRGTGVRGLTGIAELTKFGRGYLARPLLDFTRAEIAAQAARWDLGWLEDPANRDLRFDRSFLRQSVMPLLRERWPAAQRSAARLARQMAEADTLLDALAAEDAATLAELERIPCAGLRALDSAGRNNLLRFVIRRLDLPTPGAAHLGELSAAIAAERGGARIVWPGAEARIYRDHLYLMPRLTPRAHGAGKLTPSREWRGEGRLEVVPTDAPGFPDEWVQTGIDIRFRLGGERFRPLHHAHSKTLKHWFQENGVVPWMRDRIPLLFRRETLVGVADLSISEEARCAASSGPRWRAVWSEHPPVT